MDLSSFSLLPILTLTLLNLSLIYPPACPSFFILLYSQYAPSYLSSFFHLLTTTNPLRLILKSLPLGDRPWWETLVRDLTPHISDWIECYASMYPAPEVLFLPYYTALGFLLACHLLHYSILKFSSISCRIRTVINYFWNC